MKRLPLIACLFFLLSACNPSAPEESTVQPPNIVFLFADDMTYTAVQALGNAEIHTPHIDRLVQRGVSFTHTYNMGGWNGAICTASRNMLISGRSIWRANAFRQNWGKGQAFAQSWPKLMEAAGYATYMSGKWHVDAPADSLFQQALHIRPGMPPDNRNQIKYDKATGQYAMPVGYNRPLSPEDKSWSPTDTAFGGFWEGGQHWSEVLRDDALGFIEEAKDKEQPFFMYLAFNAPHDPRQAPQSYMDQYPLEELSLYGSWLPTYPYKDSIGCNPGLRDEALAPFPRSEYALKVHKQEYYAIISHLDTQIGLILDALEASGKADHTYIFFTADHGLSVGRHGLLGKQNMFDHSMRVPLMLVGPDIPAGKQVNGDVYLQDIMATSLELAGIEKPEYVEFQSLLPLAKEQTEAANYEAIYGAYVNVQRMIRQDGYKLIVYPKVPKVLLFDLKQDPEEMHNLADDPQHRERVENLFQALQKLQQEMEDELDLGPAFQKWMHSLLSK